MVNNAREPLVHASVPGERSSSGAMDRDIIMLLLRNWRRVVICGLVGAVIAVAASFSVHKTYGVSVLVAMAEGDKMRLPSTLSASGLGDLAALAGIAPPAGEERSESLAILQSYVFLDRFIRQHDLLPELYPRRWDAQQADWKGGYFGMPPSRKNAVRKFRKDALKVEEDKKTGLITIKLIWTSTESAASIGNSLVSELNETMRTRRISEAQSRIRALQDELTATQSTEVRAALFTLLQQDLKQMTVAKTRKDFALTVLDPAQTPDERDRVAPLRFIWLFMGGVVGAFIGCLLMVLRAFARPSVP